MRIYSFVGKEGVYMVLASSSEQAKAILSHEIGKRHISGLLEGDSGMSLAVMYESDMGYVIARTEEMLSPAMLA